jgi:PAS domain S-box-containing protein
MRGDATRSETPTTRSVPTMLPASSTEVYVRDLEAGVRHRDAVLAAVGYAASRFLATEDWERDIQDVLGCLGRAAEVSRVYLFESFRDEQGAVRGRMCHEWTAPGARRRIDAPEVQNLPLAEVGLGRWASLEEGAIIHGPVRSLLPSEREYFSRIGIHSIAVMPVFAGPAWWGWLGFTDDVAEREWPPSLLEALRTAAATLGAALYRKRAAEALRRREAQLAEAQAIAHLGSWEWNIASDTVTWSDELYRIHGFAPHAFIVTSERLIECVHPDDREHVRAVIKRALAERGEFSFEHRIVRPDGSVRVLRGEGKSVVDAAGVPVRMVGTGQDITERKIAEETARRLFEEQAARAEAERAERRARFLAEASRVLGTSFDYQTTLSTLVRLAVPSVADYAYIDLITADGTVECVAVTHADPAKESLLDAAAEYTCQGPPQTHPLREALVEGKPVFVPTITEDMLRAGVKSEDHWRIVEQLRPRSLIAVPLRVSNRILGALALFTAEGRRLDADDLSMGEELARRASLAVENARLYHAAQQATRARDEMLGVVAHDLRNPLGTISMAAELLLEITADTPGSLGRRQVDIIRRSAGRMNRLIEDLLDVRRIEGGQLGVEPRPVQVRALIDEALEALRPLAAASALELELELPSDLPRVLADPARIQQVLSNLVGNAIKFTPAGGRICISGWRVSGEVCLSVVDTGPGIPSDQLPHIFGRFWQGGRADRRGVGLGLAIAKGLVEAHGGRIWAESRVGHGSSFFFTLPIHGGELATGASGHPGARGADADAFGYVGDSADG